MFAQITETVLGVFQPHQHIYLYVEKYANK